MFLSSDEPWVTEVGIVGISIFGILSLVVAARTIICVFYRIHNLKLYFHATLLISNLFQLVYYIGFLIEERDSGWGYEAYLFGTYFHAAAFGMVVLCMILHDVL